MSHKDSRQRKLSVDWTSTIRDPERKKSFEQHVYNSTDVPCLMRLKELINQKIESLNTKEVNEKIYDNPSWNSLQAHYNGQREMLYWIRDLLSFVK